MPRGGRKPRHWKATVEPSQIEVTPDVGMIRYVTPSSDAVIGDEYAFYCQGGYSGAGTVRPTDGTDDDVQLKIDDAVNGDIICIPPGNYTWDEAVVWIDKDLLIIGAGVGNTIINSDQEFAFFSHITSSARGKFRITGMTVRGNVSVFLRASSNTLGAVPSGRWRVDHIHADYDATAVNHEFVQVNGVNYGLIDHITADWPLGGFFHRHQFGLNSENPSRGITITRSGSTATATADSSISDWVTGDTVDIQGANEAEYNGSFTITVTGGTTFDFTVSGTPASPATGGISVVNFSRKTLWPGNFSSQIPTGLGGADFVFVEDCTLNGYDDSNFWDVFDSSAGGGRLVWRHNSMNGNCRLYNHWTRGAEVAAQVFEIYNNTWTLGTGGLSTFDPGHVFRLEGGTGVFYNNYSNYNGGAPFVILDDRRSGGFGGPQGSEADDGRTWELCDGTHPWDGNAGDVGAPGWPCLGQPGWGWNANTSFVNLAADTHEQPNEPFYLWHNGTQTTCAETGGTCTNSIFVFPDPSAYIRSSASPHPGGIYDYREDDTPKPGYSAYTYPHPKQAEVWP